MKSTLKSNHNHTPTLKIMNLYIWRIRIPGIKRNKCKKYVWTLEWLDLTPKVMIHSIGADQLLTNR